MLTVKASGTQTASIGSEHTLSGAAITDPGTYILTVDLRNMVNGDEVELRALVKTLTGDAQEYLAYGATYAHKQGDAAALGAGANGEVVKFSPPIPSPYSISFSLKQTVGTGRAFPWRIDTL